MQKNIIYKQKTYFQQIRQKARNQTLTITIYNVYYIYIYIYIYICLFV